MDVQVGPSKCWIFYPKWMSKIFWGCTITILSQNHVCVVMHITFRCTNSNRIVSCLEVTEIWWQMLSSKKWNYSLLVLFYLQTSMPINIILYVVKLLYFHDLKSNHEAKWGERRKFVFANMGFTQPPKEIKSISALFGSHMGKI